MQKISAGKFHVEPPSQFTVAVGTRVSSRAPRTEPYVRLSRIRLPPWVCDGKCLPYAAPAPVTRSSGSASGTCFAGSHSPWSPPFAPPTPRRIAPLCSPASQLLWRGPTSRVRASSATAPHLPDAGRQRRHQLDADGQTRDLPASGAIPLHVMWP